jgi:hypothetical protein
METAQSALESIAQKQQMVIDHDPKSGFYINDQPVGNLTAVIGVFSELPPKLLCEVKPRYASNVTSDQRKALDANYQEWLDRSRQPVACALPVVGDHPDPKDHTLYFSV